MIRTGCILLAGIFAMTAVNCLAAEDAAKKETGKKKILFFSPSFGFRHSVVARPVTGELSHAEKVFKEFATKAGYEVSFSQDFHDLENPKQFEQYDAILIYSTGNPPINRNAFMNWLRNGGVIIGIHTATDSFHHDAPYGQDGAAGVLKEWPEYVKAIGGAFKTHGRTHDPVTIKVEDPKHPATTMLQDGWQIGDEIYQFDRFSRDNTHVLLSIDTAKMDDKTLQGHHMKKGEDYPVAWTRTEGKGRIFYTSLGHREDVWTNPLYQQHVLGGMAWALESK